MVNVCAPAKGVRAKEANDYQLVVNDLSAEKINIDIYEGGVLIKIITDLS